MDSTEVAQNRNGGDILSVKSEHTGRLSAHRGSILILWDRSVQMVVLSVICGSDFGQKSSHHLDYVSHRHGADFKLATSPRLSDEEIGVESTSPRSQNFVCERDLEL